MTTRSLVNVLASSMLAGEHAVEPIVARAARTLGRRWRWLAPLAQRFVASIDGYGRPRHRDVVQFLRKDPGFTRARSAHKLTIAEWLNEPQQMQPVAAAEPWDLPHIESTGDLAAWLGISLTDLLWFADLKRLASKKPAEQLRHYHYRVLTKKSGSIRLIEAPKSRLKELQRRILTGILEKIPPHPAAHGFRKARSIQTFAAPHVGRRVILRMDLRDFFPTFTAARIQALFRAAGYPEPVADLLAGISRLPPLVTPGAISIRISIALSFANSACYTPSAIFPKARQRHPHSPIYVLIASIAASVVSPTPPAPTTPAMPTISPSPAPKSSTGALSASPRTSPPF